MSQLADDNSSMRGAVKVTSLIFNARRYDSEVYAVGLCSSVSVYNKSVFYSNG